MARVFLLEAKEIRHAVDIVRRGLIPDAPIDRVIERMLLEETSLLLSLYMGLVDTQVMREDYFDVCDYYEECFDCFYELERRRDWASLKDFPIELVEVHNRLGLTALHLLNKGMADEHLRQTDFRHGGELRYLPHRRYRRPFQRR